MMRPILRWAILTLLFLASYGCRNPVTVDTNSSPSPGGLITQGKPSSVQEYEQRAVEAATKWHSDAYLTDADAVVPAMRSDGTFSIRGRISFYFQSRLDVRDSYIVGFDSQGALDTFEFANSAPKDDQLPIESRDWPLDSTDAWRIALANGGAALLEKYPQETVDMRCAVTLQRWNPPRTGRATWRVGCIDASTLKSFDFWIDAQTGEVVDKAAK